MLDAGAHDQPRSPALSALYVAGAGLLGACILRIWAVKMNLTLEVSYALTDIAWLVAYAALIVGGLGVHALFRELEARRNRLCPHCGYNLAGTRRAGITRCPECGNELEKPARAE